MKPRSSTASQPKATTNPPTIARRRPLRATVRPRDRHVQGVARSRWPFQRSGPAWSHRSFRDRPGREAGSDRRRNAGNEIPSVATDIDPAHGRLRAGPERGCAAIDNRSAPNAVSRADQVSAPGQNRARAPSTERWDETERDRGEDSQLAEHPQPAACRNRLVSVGSVTKIVGVDSAAVEREVIPALRRSRWTTHGPLRSGPPRPPPADSAAAAKTAA